MADPFIAEIRIFAGNFAPRDWAFCNGQLLQIAQNSALFSLIGTIYGGDGRSTVGLPDLRSRIPMGQGNGPGLTSRNIGVKTGGESNTLSTNQVPSHQHSIAYPASTGEGQVADSADNYAAATEGSVRPYSSASNTTMAPFDTGTTGGGQPIDNMPPWLALNFIICLAGIYPSRS